MRNNLPKVKKPTKVALQPARDRFLFLQILLRVAKVTDEDTQVADPLTTKDINEIFELDEEGKVIVKKKLVLLEQPVSEGDTPTNWDTIKGVPPLLSSINKVEGVGGNIKLAEGDNIEITNNPNENTITIASTSSAVVTSDSGGSSSSVSVNLTAGTGISVSGSSPDFTISNTNLGFCNLGF